MKSTTICSQEGNELPPQSKKPSKDLAWIAGYLLGDGCFSTGWRITVPTVDIELKEAYVKKYKRWSGNLPTVRRISGGFYKFPDGKFHYCKSRWEITITAKEVWKFLEQFDRKPLYCPEFFPKKYWEHLLKGLWDADGYITTGRCPNGLRLGFKNNDEKKRKLFLEICQYLQFHPNHREPRVLLERTPEVVKFVEQIGVTVKRKLTQEIQKRLKRFPKIREQRRFPIKGKNEWTEEELDFLKEHYQEMTDNKIAKKLDRTHSSVAHKRYRLGLRKKQTYSKHTKWSKREKEILREKYPEKGTKIKNLLRNGRTRSAIRSKAQEMGVEYA